MLPSPVTSTPFSVKDILNLEQQQHFHGAQLPADLEQHFQPCLLAAAEGTQFSDAGEDDEEDEAQKLSYLSSLAEGHGDAGLCPQSYVQTVLRDACGGPKEPEEEVVRERSQSEYPGTGAAAGPLGQWLSARTQPANLASAATRPSHSWPGSGRVQGQPRSVQVPELELGKRGKEEATLPAPGPGAAPRGEGRRLWRP